MIVVIFILNLLFLSQRFARNENETFQILATPKN